MINDDFTEIETRPHVFIEDSDQEIIALLGEIRAQLHKGKTIDQMAFAACSYMAQQVRVLKGELKRHMGMLEALAEGGQAKAAGLPLEACPYVPDEPDGKWMYWRQGWQS